MNEPSRSQQYRYSAKSGDATNAPPECWFFNMVATEEATRRALSPDGLVPPESSSFFMQYIK